LFERALPAPLQYTSTGAMTAKAARKMRTMSSGMRFNFLFG
jgi:hypothetical protein